MKDVGQFTLPVARPGPAFELIHVLEGDAAFWGGGVAHGGYVYDSHGTCGEGGGGGEQEGR